MHSNPQSHIAATLVMSPSMQYCNKAILFKKCSPTQHWPENMKKLHRFQRYIATEFSAANLKECLQFTLKDTASYLLRQGRKKERKLALSPTDMLRDMASAIDASKVSDAFKAYCWHFQLLSWQGYNLVITHPSEFHQNTITCPILHSGFCLQK